MTNFKLLRATVCLSALLCGSAAMADVTAQQVWDDWKANFAPYGDSALTIGDEQSVGGTVTVTGMSLSLTDPNTVFKINMGDMTFAEQGDGTVAVTTSPVYTMEMTSALDGTSVAKLSMNQSGAKMIVSGTPEEMKFDISADKYEFSVDELLENGVNILGGDLRMSINNLAGSYLTKDGDPRQINYDLTAGSIDFLADIKAPENAGAIVVSGKINTIATQANLSIPPMLDMTKPDAMFTSGLNMDLGYTYDSANYIWDVNGEGTSTNGSFASGNGTLNAKFGSENMDYDFLANTVALVVNSDQIPFPVNVSLAQYGLGVTMPLAKTEEPADFGMRINLTDLAVNDEIWMIGDPAGVLPHDPATVLLDVAGKAKLFFNLLDPAEAEAIANAAAPGELNELTLNSLKLAFAGALVTGEGAFTFDNTDMTTMPGMPRPEGQVKIDISGANALIDNLVKMGLVPEDQASMGRMMMGMFAVPVGDDQLTSTIEINAEGHIMANGQRIQ